jgi:flagellar L-ring protein precursor FlgH
MSARVAPLRILRAALATGLAVLAGCADLQRAEVEMPPPPPQPRVIAPVASAPPASVGAIFQGPAYRPLFENIRARAVGDLITVQIQENTTARQRSNSSVNREGKIDAAIASLPFVTTPTLQRARIGASSSNDSSAKGESGSDNVFAGTITATVVEVLPNGNLVIAGEKQVGVNQTVDSLRFSGVVDPRFIRPGNTIVSTQVADVRVEFRGRGDIDRAMKVGWLQRFFFSWSPL